MNPTPVKSRFESWLRRAPVHALRDVVVKRPSQGPNLDVLDGVRGLAVTLVIASHCGGFHLKGQGALGVFLFFCLSAFLLTMPFASRPDGIWEPARLRHYASRRARRILPIYYGVILFSFFEKSEAGLGFLWRHLLFQRADGIFWTIPQELLFYVLLPFLAILYPLVFRRRPLAAAAGFGVIAWSCHTFLDADVFSLNGNGKQLRFHLGIFCTGMAFSYAFHSVSLSQFVARPVVNRLLAGIGFAIFVLLFVSARHYHQTYLNELPVIGAVFQNIHPKMALYYKGVFGALCGLLIYITLVCPKSLVHRIMSSLTLRALGVTSYSLYLLHIIVRDKVASLGLGMGNTLFFATLAVTYVLACALYAGIERPFMQRRDQT